MKSIRSILFRNYLTKIFSFFQRSSNNYTNCFFFKYSFSWINLTFIFISISFHFFLYICGRRKCNKTFFSSVKLFFNCVLMGFHDSIMSSRRFFFSKKKEGVLWWDGGAMYILYIRKTWKTWCVCKNKQFDSYRLEICIKLF